MVAFQIREIKNFMTKLFQKEDFDAFLLREGQIRAAAEYQINGHRSHDFYTDEELEALTQPDFLLWAELKPLVFSMIRGTKTPLLLSLVFQFPAAQVEEIRKESGTGIAFAQISGAYLNVKFHAGELMLITGVGFHSFVMDKMFEREFDAHVRKFLKEKEIGFEEV